MSICLFSREKYIFIQRNTTSNCLFCLIFNGNHAAWVTCQPQVHKLLEMRYLNGYYCCEGLWFDATICVCWMFSPQQCYVGSLTMQLEGSDISLEIPHILLAWSQFSSGQGANPNSNPPPPRTPSQDIGAKILALKMGTPLNQCLRSQKYRTVITCGVKRPNIWKTVKLALTKKILNVCDFLWTIEKILLPPWRIILSANYVLPLRVMWSWKFSVWSCWLAVTLTLLSLWELGQIRPSW